MSKKRRPAGSASGQAQEDFELFRAKPEPAPKPSPEHPDPISDDPLYQTRKPPRKKGPPAAQRS